MTDRITNAYIMTRFENLDLNLLRTFDVVYTEGSLTRAARVLNISQPAVSNALSRLRDCLGDRLFIRDRRGMVPTSFAAGLAPSIHQALEAIRSGLEAREDFDPRVSERTFRVSMNDPAEALFIRPLIEACAGEAPNVSVLCNFIGRHEIGNEMSAGSLDLAIDVPTLTDGRARHASLLQETYTCLVRPEHRLAGRSITPGEYLGLGHVHVSARRYGLGHVDRALADAGCKRRIRLRIRNPEIAADIVRRTDLAMTVPQHFAAEWGLAALELPFAIPPLDWQLYWPTRLEDDASNRWLREKLLAIAARRRAERGGELDLPFDENGFATDALLNIDAGVSAT